MNRSLRGIRPVRALGVAAALGLGYALAAWVYWPAMPPATGVQQPLHYNESYVWPRPWTLTQAAPGVPEPTPFAALWGGNAVSQSFTACEDRLAMVRVWLAATRGTPSVRVSLLADQADGRHPPGALRPSSSGSADVLYTADVSLEGYGRYYAFAFPPLADSKGRRFWVHLSAPQATSDAPVAVRVGYVDAVGGLLYLNEYSTVGDLDFAAYYRGWPGLWTLRVLGERILPQLVVKRLSQYKPGWAKGATFGLLAAALGVGCAALLWASWPKNVQKPGSFDSSCVENTNGWFVSAEHRSSSPAWRPNIRTLVSSYTGKCIRSAWIARSRPKPGIWRSLGACIPRPGPPSVGASTGVAMVLLVTALALGWRDVRAAIGIGERRVPLVPGTAAQGEATNDPRVTHDLLIGLEFAGRHPEPRFVQGSWVAATGDRRRIPGPRLSEPWPAILAPGTSRVGYRLDVPFDAELRFRYARTGGDGPLSIQVAGDQVWQAMADVDRTTRTEHVQSIRRWQEATVDLRPWAGQTVALSLVAEGSGQVLWGNPQIVSARTWLRSYPLPADEPGFQPLWARFGDARGDEIELLGYAVSMAEGALRVALYWRAQRPVAGDYTVFVHALDATGQMAGQRDSRPVGGTYPTNIWPAAQVVVDRHEVPLKESIRWLAIGLYELQSLERLPAWRTDNTAWADSRVMIELRQ